MPSARYSGYGIAEAAELFALEIAPGTLTELTADYFEREIANYSTIAEFWEDHGGYAYCIECDRHYAADLEGVYGAEICNGCEYESVTTGN